MTAGEVTYCQVDGILRDSGEYVLMEVEALEPHLYMETSTNVAAKERMYSVLLGPEPVAPKKEKLPVIHVREVKAVPVLTMGISSLIRAFRDMLSRWFGSLFGIRTTYGLEHAC
jgi:hypothetical protein